MTTGEATARAVAVEVVARCPACTGVVPINALGAAVACAACGRRIELGDAVWSRVLSAETLDTAAHLRDGDEDAALVEAGAVKLRVVVRRTAAHCLACREPLPTSEAEELALARRRVLRRLRRARAAPQAAGHRARRRAPGQAEEAAGAASREPRHLSCGARAARRSRSPAHEPRGRLLVLATRRAPVPDDPAWWRDPHPVRDGAPPLVSSSSRTLQRRRSAEVTWTRVVDAAVDAGREPVPVGLLDAGMDAATAVRSLAPDMSPRWAKRGLAGLPVDRAQLFVAQQGRVGLWFLGGKLVAFLDARSGETVGTYPATPTSPHPVPIERCGAIAADVDGTWLALVIGEGFGGMVEHTTLVRFTEAGLVDLWPGVPPPSPPELGEAIPWFRDQTSQPKWFAGTPRLAVGWDGTLLVWGGNFSALGWVRVARDGFVTNEPHAIDSTTCVAGDGAGSLHILTRGDLVATDRTTRRLWRLSADGGPAGLAGEHLLVVAKSGETTLFGNGGRMRRIDARGVVVFARRASRRADQGGA